MANPFCFIELATDDTAKAKEFYGSLFSWTFEDMNMGEGGTYTMLQTGDGPGGGIMAKKMPGQPTMWTSYVQVADLDASVAKVDELGGKVIVGKTAIPNMGSFAIVEDPTGGVLGLWQGQG